jgi:hypothetical protein
MMFFMATDAYALIFAAILSYTVYITKKRNRLPYPPGPKGYPLLGNALEKLGDERWIAYRYLATQHSEYLPNLSSNTAINVLDTRD